MTALPLTQPRPATPAIRVRPLGPADGDLLDAVFDGMGERSRYQRFHASKPRLTAGERRYLTATDGRDHLALVAFDRAGRPVGIARCVRLRDRPATAEIAAEVVDDRQGEGIGSDLLRRIARQAAGVGIERLTATVLVHARLARTLTRRGWRVTGSDGTALTIEAPAYAAARWSR